MEVVQSSSIVSVTQQVIAEHVAKPRATIATILQAEKRLGFALDSELAFFYSHSNGAELFARTDWRYRILSVSQVQLVGPLILGDTNARYPANWFAICDVQDSNYVAIEVDDRSGRVKSVRDCFHESFPSKRRCRVIANTFADFLRFALEGGDRLYWL